MAIAAMLTLLAVPNLLRQSAGHQVRLAAAETVTLMRLARSSAIRLNVRVGVKFVIGTDGVVHYRMYQDTDGDGVRSADIAAGIDSPLGPARRMAHLGHRVGFGFPPGRAPRDPGNPKRRLDRLDDPIRFNRSNIASFDPMGTSTPGSLYLTDHRDHLVAVRVVGLTGRVRTLIYDVEKETWR
jgi:hypothetical protein